MQLEKIEFNYDRDIDFVWFWKNTNQTWLSKRIYSVGFWRFSVDVFFVTTEREALLWLAGEIRKNKKWKWPGER